MEGIVYHGSPKGDIKELVRNKSTHGIECIYAAATKAVAMSFMGRGMGDLDTLKDFTNGKLSIVERRPGVFNNLYNKEGYIYELDASTFNHSKNLWIAEVISLEERIKPLRVIHYPNILKALEEEEKKGNLIMYRYPNRPKEIPLDNSDLIDKYIFFENSGIKGAIDSLLKVYPEFKEEVKKRINQTNSKIIK